ncbi:Inositol-pentakisphosphate 2-kinase, partial [Fragariocoptes setiger]
SIICGDWPLDFSTLPVRIFMCETARFPTFAPDMIYRGEGNSNLVIAIKSDAKVLRVLKKDGKIVKFGDDNHVRRHAASTIDFIRNIMRPLSNNYFIDAPTLIHLKSDVIARLNALVKDLRPLHRMNKSLIHEDQDALVMTDYCVLRPAILQHYGDHLVGPTISVEIKPKQGFLPITMPDANNSTCIYGMTQYLKLAKGRITRISQYCPLDLFSGCPERMRQALRSLIHTPQNNFRIFRDLTLVYGERDKQKFSSVFKDFFAPEHIQNSYEQLESRFISLIIEALTTPFPMDSQDESNSSHDLTKLFENVTPTNNDFCQAHAYLCPAELRCTDCQHITHKNCILASVLRVQKLDTIGANSALRMLQWLMSQCQISNATIKSLNAPVLPHNLGSPFRQMNESKANYYYRKVWEFLVSMTAKDCSIMLSMQRLKDSERELRSSIENADRFLQNHVIIDPETGARYVFSLGITDLDQKSAHNIARTCKKYKRMLLCKNEILANTMTSDDQRDM